MTGPWSRPIAPTRSTARAPWRLRLVRRPFEPYRLVRLALLIGSAALSLALLRTPRGLF